MHLLHEVLWTAAGIRAAADRCRLSYLRFLVIRFPDEDEITRQQLKKQCGNANTSSHGSIVVDGRDLSTFFFATKGKLESNSPPNL